MRAGSQLNGQGQPVEPPADLRHILERPVIDRQARIDGAGALDIKADGVVVPQHFRVRSRVLSRQRQRMGRQLVLALHAEWSTAGRQHLQRGTGREQTGDKDGGVG